jgi:hypothetical protein
MSIQNVNSAYSETSINNLGDTVTVDGGSSSALNPPPTPPSMTVGEYILRFESLVTLNIHPLDIVLPESVYNNEEGDLSSGLSLSNLN